MKAKPGFAASLLRYTVMAGALAASTLGVAYAQQYPNKPITLIMPFGAGGPPDAYGRVFAEKLSQRIGQPVIVENRPGANGTIGCANGAKARPDGYTILYGTNSCTAAAKGLFKSLSYDPLKDLKPVTIVAHAYFVLAVPLSEKDTSIAEYLEKVRKDPAKYPIGGASGTAQTISAMIQNAGKLDYTYVSYAASPQMVTDLLGGRLGGMIHPVAGSSALINSGKMHGMALVAPQTLSAVPGVPILNDTLPDIDLGAWTGIFVPGETPQAVVDTLYENIAEVLKDPAVIEITELGGVVVKMTPTEAQQFVDKEAERWPVLLKAAGIEPV